jgi:hypothetical protein
MSGARDENGVDLGISLEAVATIVDHSRAFIADLNEDEGASLAALTWVGRGDYGAEEWDEARGLAAERAEGRDTADYLLGMDNLGDLLAEGVATFGFSIEDVDR